jgi:hypothetical protein
MLVLLLLRLVLPAPERGAAPGPDAFAVEAEFERMAARPLWPGFDAADVPLAIYDGTRTVLFRHPSAPPEFLAVEGHPGAFAVAGRHPSVTANSSASVGGVQTATALAGGSAATARELAAVVIHEAFHVFQQKKHASWTADEGQLFLYPFEDAANLAEARLEIATWRRALLARSPATARCVAGTAARIRRARRERLPAAAAAYERGIELKEGLAAYVQADAAGTGSRSLGRDSFPAEDVRTRAYTTGPLVGRLLDRLLPAWKERLEAGEAASLDELLSLAAPAPRPACGPSRAERASALELARRDVAALDASRARAREEFLAAAGWTLVVEAAGEPLWPQGFDPLNVRRIAGREVLHSRFVKLGNAAGTIEVLGRAALTEGQGPHPLFQGVRRLTVTGLPGAPPVPSGGRDLTIDLPGLRLRLAGVESSLSGGILRVRLRPDNPGNRE